MWHANILNLNQQFETHMKAAEEKLKMGGENQQSVKVPWRKCFWKEGRSGAPGGRGFLTLGFRNAVDVGDIDKWKQWKSQTRVNSRETRNLYITH